MLTEIYPRVHARYSSLPVLGPHLDGFVQWLRAQGYPLHPIHLRVRAARRLDARLRRRKVRRPSELTAEQFLAFAPKDSQTDIDLAAVVRSLVSYFKTLIGESLRIDSGNPSRSVGESCHLSRTLMQADSGRDFTMLCAQQDTTWFLAAHVAAFARFAGLIAAVAYNDLTAAVAKILMGAPRVVRPRFAAMIAHYALEARFCRPGEGHDKGGVESRGGQALVLRALTS